jgi:uncharacterized protein YodC (DUF2158 family)
MDFHAGDLVKLKSGGPVMTVERVGKASMTEEEAVWCVWFETVRNQRVGQRETFPPIVLEKAQKPGVGSVRLSRA